jgi:hypothetical protein
MEDVIHPLAPSGEVRVEGEEGGAFRDRLQGERDTVQKNGNFDLEFRF